MKEYYAAINNEIWKENAYGTVLNEKYRKWKKKTEGSIAGPCAIKFIGNFYLLYAFCILKFSKKFW